METNLFLQKLNSLLKKVPEHERREMLYDFEEHFQAGLVVGHTIETLAAELGDPKVIAKELIAEYRLSRAEMNRSIMNITRAVFALISLSMMNLLFLFVPFAIISSIYLSLWIVTIALVLTPILIIVFLFFFNLEFFLYDMFFSIVLSSAGLLLSIGLICAGKFFYHTILTYIKFNVKIVKGETR